MGTRHYVYHPVSTQVDGTLKAWFLIMPVYCGFCSAAEKGNLCSRKRAIDAEGARELFK